MTDVAVVVVAACIVLSLAAIGVGIACFSAYAGLRDRVEEAEDREDRALALAGKAYQHAATALSTVTDNHESYRYGKHANPPTDGATRDGTEAEALQGLRGGGSDRGSGSTTHREVPRSPVLRPSPHPKARDAAGRPRA